MLLPLPAGGQIPMEEIADIAMVSGPSMIRDENGLLAGYIYVDFDTSKVDVGSYVGQAKLALSSALKVPTGYALAWSGQYENMLRVKERLKEILPLTLVLIFMLLFLDLSYDEAKKRGQLNTSGNLVEAIIHGAVKRVWRARRGRNRGHHAVSVPGCRNCSRLNGHHENQPVGSRRLMARRVLSRGLKSTSSGDAP